jgi:hypothetical protein
MIFSWPSTHPDPMCKLSLIDVVHTPVFTEPVNDLINLFNSGDRLRSACAMVSKAGVQSVGAPEPKKLEVQLKINAPLYSAGIPTLRIQTSSRKTDQQAPARRCIYARQRRIGKAFLKSASTKMNPRTIFVLSRIEFQLSLERGLGTYSCSELVLSWRRIRTLRWR